MPKYVQESRKDGIREVVRGYITSAYAVKEKEQEVAPIAPQDPESSGFSTILNTHHSNLLIWYVEEVQNAMESRQDAHVDIAQNTYEQFLTTKRRTDSLATDICTLCPGTDLLETNDIEILFRYCSFASLWMDSAWINSSQCHVAPQDSSDPLTTFIYHFQSTITIQLARLKLDIYEYAALKAFCIWKLGILDSTITLKIVAGEQYLGITNALSNYYQNVKNLEPFVMATRMADITLMIAPIFNVYQDMLKLYHTLQIEAKASCRLSLAP